MLKNLSLGMKIGGGFGILILIALLLGGVAIWNMKRVGNIADELQTEVAPQVAVAVQVERSSLLTMYAMRAFQYTGDEKSMADVEKNLGDVDQPPGVVPLIVLVCDAYLSPAVVPRGSTLPRGAGLRPALADVAQASYAA